MLGEQERGSASLSDRTWMRLVRNTIFGSIAGKARAVAERTLDLTRREKRSPRKGTSKYAGFFGGPNTTSVGVTGELYLRRKEVG